MENKFPNLIVAGTVKGGTTSLHHYLSQHPEVFMSPVKEPHYFDTDIDPGSFSRLKKDFIAYNERLFRKEGWAYLSYTRDGSAYRRFFENAGAVRLAGESTPYYMVSRVAALNIKKRCPDARILMVIRNPVERAWSHYLMNVREGVVKKDFTAKIREDLKLHEECVRTGNFPQDAFDSYLELGLYSAQIKRFLENFPKENVKVVLSQDLREPVRTMKEIFRFLGIDGDFRPDTDKLHNQTNVPRFRALNNIVSAAGLKQAARALLPAGVIELSKKIYFSGGKPEMPAEAKALLRDFFREDILETEKVIGRGLQAWIK